MPKATFAAPRAFAALALALEMLDAVDVRALQ